MAKIAVYDINRKQVAERELNDGVFNADVKGYLIHDMVRYQLAARRLSEHAEGLEPMLAFAECGVRPELTLWFDLPASLALQRIRQRQQMGHTSTRLDEEALSFHEAVAAAFAALQARETGRIRRIDASGSVDAVQGKVREALQKAMELQGV